MKEGVQDSEKNEVGKFFMFAVLWPLENFKAENWREN